MAEKRALIADDHELFSWALRSLLLKDFDFDDVHLVGNRVDALRTVADDPALKLLCLDLSMPGMNGFESVRAIRAAAGPGVFVVIVTASTRRDDVAEAIKAGVHGYISKTMRTPDISEAIRKILDGQVFVPPMVTQTYVAPESERRVAFWPTAAEEKNISTDGEKSIQHWGDLTPRQKAVGELILRGRSNKEIAIALGLAEGTVKVHVAALFRLLDVRNRAEAVMAMVNIRSLAR